jgi:hypothetical protein
MTVTFKNDNDVIIYSCNKIISYARKSQQIFVAQYVWWLASVIGLELGLINYIDNLKNSQDQATPKEATEPLETLQAPRIPNVPNTSQDLPMED